jgi:hypothetical protein
MGIDGCPPPQRPTGERDIQVPGKEHEILGTVIVNSASAVPECLPLEKQSVQELHVCGKGPLCTWIY